MITVFIGKAAPRAWLEEGRTYNEIVEYINSLGNESLQISTNNLFVLRELELRFGEQLEVINTDNGLKGQIDFVGEIQMLEEELKQSDRYMAKKYG